MLELTKAQPGPMNKIRKLPICRSHIFEDELPIEKVYLGMCSWHVLIISCKVVIISSTHWISLFHRKVNKKFFLNFCAHINAFENNLFVIAVDWFYSEQIRAYLYQHSRWELKFVMNFNERARCCAHVNEVKILALSYYLSVMILYCDF